MNGSGFFMFVCVCMRVRERERENSNGLIKGRGKGERGWWTKGINMWSVRGLGRSREVRDKGGILDECMDVGYVE